MIALWIAAGLAGLFVLFVILPAAFFSVFFFSRLSMAGPGKYDYATSDLAPYADRLEKAASDDRFNEFENISINSPDGTALYGKIKRKGSSNAVIFFHGYRASPEVVFPLQIAEFLKEDCDIVFVYQRAHRPYPGKHCTFGIKEGDDVVAWTSYVKKTHPGKVVVYGVSMGGGAVCYASDRLGGLADLIVADCALTSPLYVIELVMRKRKIPDILLTFFIRIFVRIYAGIDIRENTASHLEKCSVPVLFLHGDADDTVEHKCSEENLRHTPSGELITVKGAGHAAAFAMAGVEIMNKIREMTRINNTQELRQ